MTFWDVHLTLRDPNGARRDEFVGAYAADDLSEVLARAFQRAGREQGGVQVRRQRPASVVPRHVAIRTAHADVPSRRAAVAPGAAPSVEATGPAA